MEANSTEYVKPQRVKIGGLWKSETKTGKVYYSGQLGFGSGIEIWANNKREGSKDPDFQVYIVERRKKVDVQAVVATVVNDFPQNDEEIPF